MQDKILELIQNALFLFIGFSLGRLWVGRKVAEKLDNMKKIIDGWQVERNNKFEEIFKGFDDLKKRFGVKIDE